VRGGGGKRKRGGVLFPTGVRRYSYPGPEWVKMVGGREGDGFNTNLQVGGKKGKRGPGCLPGFNETFCTTSTKNGGEKGKKERRLSSFHFGKKGRRKDVKLHTGMQDVIPR